jgi:alcohol dehydrogenase
MRAVLYEQFGGALCVRDVPEPVVPADGVVVAVRANGICRSDWHGWMGHDPDIRLPHVPGHELAGVITATGPRVRRWREGDRVTVPFAVGCGRCRPCEAGQLHICDHQFQPGFTAWGSFAERVAIPRADLNLVALPADLDDVAAASLGCRFSTAYWAVAVRGRVQPGEWVAVHGCGGVGLAAVLLAQALGAQVVAIDVRPEPLAVATALGATHALDSRTTADPAGAIRDLTGGGAHLALDALGSRDTCRNAILSLRKRGRHVQVGLLLADDHDPAVPMSAVIARELEILGSHGMPAHAYPRLFELIRAGRLQPGRLVRKTVSLDDAPAELVALGAFRTTGMTVINRF